MCDDPLFGFAGARRSETVCPMFGTFAELNNKQLPTISEVIKCILLTRHELKVKHNGKQPSHSDIFQLVSEEIHLIWKNASLPTVSQDRVRQLLKHHFDKYLSLIRYPNSKKNKAFEQKWDDYKSYCLITLFDISSCKCKEKCSCPKERKVPVKEIAFLMDQRGERRMIIGNTDKIETQKIQNKMLRKEKQAQSSIDNNVSSPKPVTSRAQRKDPRNTDESNTDPHNVTETVPAGLQKNYNQVSLPTVATLCDRYRLSSRKAAALTTAVLVDVGLVTNQNSNLIIDKNKIRREISKSRLETQEESSSITPESIYFDGRKDKTLISETKGSRIHRKEILEEHISILSEPGAQYLGHTTPDKGTGSGIATSITDFLIAKQYNTEGIKCVGCDGTATNTGWKGGAIQYLEKQLGRPLQWAVCLLHANELPLRHLFAKLDGSTTGPREFSGPIGKKLPFCEKMNVTAYQPVAGNMPNIEDEIINELSTDQKYLYEICQAVASGLCTPDLANRQPGKMAHSRWLTFANRVLRLYVSTNRPSKNLKIVVEYIMSVYAPVWFSIKAKPTLKDGSLHLFNMIQLSRSLPENVKNVIDPVIQRNAFFGHPENLLLAMLYDPRNNVQQLAVERIIQARTSSDANERIRIFKPPQINFLAADYTDLLDWQDILVTPPPVLSQYSNENLQTMVETNVLPPCEYPCHTQAVERTVKLVTEASESVIGELARDGLIKNTLKSRMLMPKFDSKKDFRGLQN